MEKKRLLMDQDAIMRAIRRISHEILERNKGLSNALIVGIERRGVILAKRLQAEIERIEGIRIECESLNVAMYRDDRDSRNQSGCLHTSCGCCHTGKESECVQVGCIEAYCGRSAAENI